MKILLADDHALVRDGIAHLLRRFKANAEIVEAADFPTAQAIAETEPDLDLILLDLAMPGMNGIEGIERLRDSQPTVPVIVLSSNEDPRLIERAIDAGAKGYIPKSSPTEVMLTALELVISGSVYLPPALLSPASMPDPLWPDSAHNNPEKISGLLDRLTRRQLEVLKLVARGLSNKLIGRELDVSEATVRVHVTAILKTLNVSNRTEASYQAMKLGLVYDADDLPDP